MNYYDIGMVVTPGVRRRGGVHGVFQEKQLKGTLNDDLLGTLCP